jgi:methylenetetrahydrofolate dehydrogenase (NADP+)/methenyltetrahydrofolate cyclohydrolase
MSKKELVGSDVAGFVKERQIGSVRSLGFRPKLAIVCTNKTPVTDVYLRIKQAYADDIGADTEVVETTDAMLPPVIQLLNDRPDVNGVVIQLPLNNPALTETVLSLVNPEKDIDGLGKDALYDPATPTAVLWLLAAYNIDLRGKKVLVVGQGRLVGAPLARMLRDSGVDITTADDTTTDIKELCLSSHIIISATGQPNLITDDMVPLDAVIIDAGTATDNGEVVGDVGEEVRSRPDVTITPKKGGVGPLTIAALFDNLIRSARAKSE